MALAKKIAYLLTTDLYFEKKITATQHLPMVLISLMRHSKHRLAYAKELQGQLLVLVVITAITRQ